LLGTATFHQSMWLEVGHQRPYCRLLQCLSYQYHLSWNLSQKLQLIVFLRRHKSLQNASYGFSSRYQLYDRVNNLSNLFLLKSFSHQGGEECFTNPPCLPSDYFQLKSCFFFTHEFSYMLDKSPLYRFEYGDAHCMTIDVVQYIIKHGHLFLGKYRAQTKESNALFNCRGTRGKSL
jgi:hypothetical protein